MQTHTPERFARWVFRLAGSIGLLIILAMFFAEGFLARDQPPPINHPEWFYGFLAVTLAFQVVFLIISTDPVRYRPLMPAAILEKVGYIAALATLFALGRVEVKVVAGTALDALWAVLFIVAYLRTPRGGAFVAEVGRSVKE